MATFESSSTENRNRSKKRKRKSSQEDDNNKNSERDAKEPRNLSLQISSAAADEEEKEENEKCRESITTNKGIPWKRCVNWKNLDFVLSLQNKQLPHHGKIELAFDFINTPTGNEVCSIYDHQFESVQMQRLIAFLNDWIQSILASPEKELPAASNQEDFDPRLDFRTWAVFKFCLKEGSSLPLTFSSKLLDAVSHVMKHTLSNSVQCLNISLFEAVSDCCFLIFSSHGRSLNANTSAEAWVLAADVSLNLARKIFMDFPSRSSADDTLLGLSSSVLKPFANYLRVHPNPKNIFRDIIDRLLEQLLAMLVLLSPVNGSNCEFFNIVEDILSNGLFHPAHIEGFLTLHSSKKHAAGSESLRTVTKELKVGMKSYHKHLFWKLEQLASENKMFDLGGLGRLLLLFIRRVKNRKTAPAPSLGSEKMGIIEVSTTSESLDGIPKFDTSAMKHSSVLENSISISRLDEETCKSVFDIFVQFMEPLILGIKRYSEMNWSEVGMSSETMISNVHCSLKSFNNILACFIYEKVYVRTEDTSEGAHFNFLKKVYDTGITFASKIHVLWQSALNVDDRRCAQMLCLAAKEVIVFIAFFLEIEYKVIGSDLVGLWILMLSFVAIDLSLVETQQLVQEVLSLGCKLVNVYSELRQVRDPIFALCKAVRFLAFPSNDCGMCDSRFVSFTDYFPSGACVRSVVTFSSSHELRSAVSMAIKSIPEGQASGFIRQLQMDITEILDWMKSCYPEAIGKELAETKLSKGNVLSLCLRAELLGKGLAELYALILDSSTVTTGNSVLLGNSVKDLMRTIEPSLSILVENQSDAVSEFLLVIAGRRFSSHKIKKHKSSISWICVFFFRLFISCRSLYRQSISLMPPGSSRKASSAMGDLFTPFSGKDWLERGESADWMDGGYFSWVAKSPASLLVVIRSVMGIFIQDAYGGNAPLVLVFHIMAFQRLVELNRQIKAFEYMQDKSVRLTQSKLLDDVDMHLSHKGRKKLEKHILVSKQEATDLTNFLTGYLPLITKKRKSTSPPVKDDVTDAGQDGQAVLVMDEEDAWNVVVCSVDDKSLPTAIWWLLCANTDVWCVHATEKNLKKFLSHLFHHSLSLKNLRQQTMVELGHPKVTSHCISFELLRDAALYEQRFLCRHLTSTFCCILKESLSPLLSFSSDVDFDSLPDWSDVLTELEKAQVVGKNGIRGHYGGSGVEIDVCQSKFLPRVSHKGLEVSPVKFVEIDSLLNLLCWIPKGYGSSKSFAVYTVFILNVERLLVPILLNYGGELFLGKHYEIFKLFVSCRRALRYLVLSSGGEKLEASSVISILSENSSPVLWLFKSMSEVVGLSPAFSEEGHNRQVKNMMFSLMDHTSYVFLALSESHMSAVVQPLVNEQIPSKDLHTCNKGNGQDGFIEAEPPSYTFELFNFLMEQTRNLFTALKETTHNSNLEAGVSVVNWTRASSMICCFQGFLWGIASALSSIDEAKARSEKWRFGRVFEHNLCTDVFEEFVNFCLNILLVEDSEEPESAFAVESYSELGCRNKALSSKETLRSAVEPSVDEFENCPENKQDKDSMDGQDDYMVSDSDDETKDFGTSGANCSKPLITSEKTPVPANIAVNAFTEVHNIDLFELKHLNKSMLQSLLKGEKPEVAFTVRQLFIASSAILKLKYLLSSMRISKVQIGCCQSLSTSTVILIGASHFVLSEFAEMVGSPHPFSFVWLDGIIKYLEVLGNCFPSTDPLLTKNVYRKLIDIHLRAIGKCISLQGKSATLESHEIESRTKTFQDQEESSYIDVPSLCQEKYDLNELKSRFRMSFKAFIRKPLKLHLLSALQTLVRALVGVKDGCHVIYEVSSGNEDGGKASPIVAAGVDCLDLVLEYVSGPKRSKVVKKESQSLISALFNIVLHLQSPLIFFHRKSNHDKDETVPDSGSIILMCVEVLTKIAGRHSLLQMDPSHVAQSLHIPTTLFAHFLQLKTLTSTSHSLLFTARKEVKHIMDKQAYIVHRQFSVELFAACCKLLCTVLKHKKSESGRCVSVLEDSVNTLLHCLEMVDADVSGSTGFLIWGPLEGIKCASFLRRIYEEIRHQKDILGRYSFHFLSNYIWVFCGYGPLKRGIRREIDETLRPGVYALIDVCSPADLQQLYTVLGDGPCRSTLATLQHDYKLNFQYEGKV